MCGSGSWFMSDEIEIIRKLEVGVYVANEAYLHLPKGRLCAGSLHCCCGYRIIHNWYAVISMDSFSRL